MESPVQQSISPFPSPAIKPLGGILGGSKPSVQNQNGAKQMFAPNKPDQDYAIDVRRIKDGVTQLFGLHNIPKNIQELAANIVEQIILHHMGNNIIENKDTGSFDQMIKTSNLTHGR